MQRSRVFVPSGPRRAVVGAGFVFALGLAACGGEEDCSITNSCPNEEPTATITSPAANATFDEFQGVPFEGSATDPEDGALTGASLVWTSNIDGGIGTGTSFSRSDLTTGTHLITLRATDSDGATGIATVSVVIEDLPNARPDAEITSPADGASFDASESIIFTGTATDPEDGSLTGQSLVWTSDLDGVLGTGATVTTEELSGGTHEIVLTATDTGGAFGADTIDVVITGAPSVNITAPTDQASGAPHTVFEASTVTFTGSGTDAQDGALSGASLVWTSNVDGQIGTGTSFGTSALTPGLHTVTLMATDSDGNEARARVLVIVKPPAEAGYQIHIRWSEGVELTPAQQAAVDAAVSKLENVITGDVVDFPETEFPDAGTCGGAALPKMDESVDDVIIYLEFVPIDGPGKTIGSAGPCFTRSNTAFSLVGGMRFDSEDLQTLDQLGLMEDIVLHEMMHVLGFGIFWEPTPGSSPPDLPFDYLEQPSDPTHPDHVAGMNDTHFTGPEATAQFLAIGGDDYTGGEIVPVENDNQPPEPIFSTGSLDGHWRESVFDEEIMSTAANVANFLSVVTVGQFEDLGYTVDYAAADPYTQTFSVLGAGQLHSQGRLIDLSGDVWRGPLLAIDPDGSHRRIR